MPVLENEMEPVTPLIPASLEGAPTPADMEAQYEGVGDASLTEQTAPIYDEYQSGAEGIATDTSFQDSVNAADSSTYVTPEARVSDQLSTLLSADSPYMTQVANRSAEQANQLGLLSSSMAVGAGQRAAIESALPIAQQDAGMYATLAQQQQATENQGLLAGQQAHNTAQGNIAEGIVSANLTAHSSAINQANQMAQNTFTQSNQIMQNQFTAALKGADAATQSLLNESAEKWNMYSNITTTAFTKKWEERLLQGTVEQERYDSAMSSSNQIMQNTQTAITTLMQDPDIMSQDPADVAGMFNVIYDQAQASMEFIGGLGEVPQADFDTLLESFNLAVEFGTEDVVQVPIA